MKRKSTIFTMLTSLLFLGTACISITTNKDSVANNEKLLMERVKAFNTAFKEGDVETLETMITENYQHTNGNSEAIGKTAWLAWLQQRKKSIESGDLKPGRYEMKETQITWHGNTAIITAKIETSTTLSGTVQKNAYRLTNIWVKEGETWKRAGFHDGKIE